MNNHFTGSFYFDKTVNGNLIGEFSNNGSDSIMTESATAKSNGSNFEGGYISTWFDIDLTMADLTITKKGKKYLLEWTNTGKEDFTGEGFLSGDKLIGFYKKK